MILINRFNCIIVAKINTKCIINCNIVFWTFICTIRLVLEEKLIFWSTLWWIYAVFNWILDYIVGAICDAMIIKWIIWSVCVWWTLFDTLVRLLRIDVVGLRLRTLNLMIVNIILNGIIDDKLRLNAFFWFLEMIGLRRGTWDEEIWWARRIKLWSAFIWSVLKWINSLINIISYKALWIFNTNTL